MKKSHTLRILLALLVIFGAFAYIVYGLAQLQLVKGEGYSDSAGRKSIKTIRTTGKLEDDVKEKLTKAIEECKSKFLSEH